MNPDQTAPHESSLIWAHTVCNITYCLQNKLYENAFIMEANTMNTDQTAPHGSSLIWVHTVCNISYYSKSALILKHTTFITNNGKRVRPL